MSTFDEMHSSADPLAARWRDVLPLRDDPAASYDEHVQAGLALRAQVFDDATDRFLRPCDIRRHLIHRRYFRALVQPVVVELGGGLSTRYQRIGKDRARWIEVDVPAAIALRCRLDMETFEHRFLARSPTDPAWLEELPDIPPTEMLFIAEGARFHADPTILGSLVDQLRQRFAESTVLLHVRDEAEVIALGLRPIVSWPLAMKCADRLLDCTTSSSTPSLSDVGMLVEAIVEPLAV